VLLPSRSGIKLQCTKDRYIGSIYNIGFMMSIYIIIVKIFS
jgi:hypothetical protein